MFAAAESECSDINDLAYHACLNISGKSIASELMAQLEGWIDEI